MSSDSDIKCFEKILSFYNTQFTLILKIAMERLDLCTSLNLGETFYELIIQEVSLIHFIANKFGEQVQSIVVVFEYLLLPFTT